MSRFVLALVVLVVLVAALAAPAASAAKKSSRPSWVALVHAEGDIPAGWLTRLRAAVEKADARNWVDPPAIALDEAAGVVGCAWSAACAAQVAGMTGAKNAVLVEIKRQGDGASVSVETLGADGSTGGSPEVVEVAALDDDGLALAVSWVTGAVKGKLPTILIVTADLDPTEVVIDNVPVGKTPLTLVDKVTPGPHALLLRREGKAPLSRAIDVKAGALTRENGVLASGGPPMVTPPTVGNPVVQTPPPPPPATTPAQPDSSLALVGWGLGGVGGATALLSGGVSAFYWARSAALRDPESGGFVREVCQSGDDFVAAGEDGCGEGTLVAGGDREPEKIGVAELNQRTIATTTAVIAAVGVLVAVTGIGLALSSGGGEEADAAAAAAR